MRACVHASSVSFPASPLVPPSSTTTSSQTGDEPLSKKSSLASPRVPFSFSPVPYNRPFPRPEPSPGPASGPARGSSSPKPSEAGPDTSLSRTTASPGVNTSCGESNFQLKTVCHDWAVQLALWFRALSPIPIPSDLFGEIRRSLCMSHELRHTLLA